MKKMLVITSVSLLFLMAFSPAPGFEAAVEKKPITITILYDNYPFAEGLNMGPGFSCLIQWQGKNLLFDTGGSFSNILFENMNSLGINPNDIGLIVLSHDHDDHTGGLIPFLNKNNKVSVYLLPSFSSEFVAKVEGAGAKVIKVSEPTEIFKDVYLTGEMGVQIKEQSLILDTHLGLIVITGCAHPGIVDILNKAKETHKKDIYLVLGGFHLRDKPEDELKTIIGRFKDLGVLSVGPTHCTGDRAIELFKQAYGKNLVQMGVGKVIKVSY